MSRASLPAPSRISLALAALLAVVLSFGLPSAAVAQLSDGTSNTDGTSTTSDDTDDTEEDAAGNRSRADDPERGKRSGEASGHADDGTAGTSGDSTEPQPLSTADENEGGANGDCPEGEYCSTRDGSESENGAGDGAATGKPCAGCVGKADNKNPQGQMPNADEDGNSGYECDTNQGIGQGNPAHTACTPEEALAAEQQAPVVAGVEAFADPARADTAVAGAQAAAPEQAADAVSPVAALLPNTGAGALLGGATLAGLALLVVGATMLRRRSTS